jgi:predicted RNase H-like nuclease
MVASGPACPVATPDVVDVVGGLDGCRAGWLLATATACPTGPGAEAPHVRVVEDLSQVLDLLMSGILAEVGVDIPIGLTAPNPRRCDLEARRLLGPRRSSVFPAPARAVLGATSYEEACTRSLEACGKKVSKQVFNILPRIGEVDGLLSPALQSRMFEICPELSFAMLWGAPMCANKHTPEGRAERMQALRREFGDLTALVTHPPPGAAPDDVLDAIAGAWTVRRHAVGLHLRLGGQEDEKGLRMEVVV